MAIVFISPKQRQKVFFRGITLMFLLVLAVISSMVFFSKPKETVTLLSFNKPKVNIDMSVFNSNQFQNLESFPEMKIQYSYSVKTKAGKIMTGFMSASSEDEVYESLTKMGLEVATIKEAELGRDEPFSSYYVPTTPATSSGTTTNTPANTTTK